MMKHSKDLMVVSTATLTMALLGGICYLYLVNLEGSSEETLSTIATEDQSNAAAAKAAIMRLQTPSPAANLSAEERQIAVDRLLTEQSEEE